MNVSSEAFRPNLVAIPIEHRPILYVDFFDALDTRLGLNTRCTTSRETVPPVTSRRICVSTSRTGRGAP